MPSIPQIQQADRLFPEFDVAGLAGASFKPQHLQAIAADPASSIFFEVHAENYMGAGGPPHAALAQIRRDHPVSLHGVAMSIGGSEPLDRNHLSHFAELVKRYEPALVSEHLAWSTHDDVYFNDLLPLPYTKATLARVCDHIGEVQDAIGRIILLENPSTYVAFAKSDYAETDFIAQIVRRTGCGLLLDINNVFISAENHGFSPIAYLGNFPLEQVKEIHLAGHDRQADEAGNPLLIDTHDRPIADPVWNLYRMVIAQCGPLPTLVEWDADVPDWPVLKAEAMAAQAIMDAARPVYMMGRRHG